MVDRDTLTAAINAEILSLDQAEKLKAFIEEREAGSGGSERIKFLSNLNDIFLSLGIIILGVGLFIAFGWLFALGQFGFGEYAPVWALLPVIGVMWLLSEYFCGRRKMLLPSMVLSLTIVICVAVAAFVAAAFAVAYNNSAQIGAVLFGNGDDADLRDLLGSHALSTSLIAFSAGLAAAAGFYYRFRLPFSLLLCALMVSAMVYAIILKANGLAVFVGGGVMLAVGLATLCAAIFFDMRDPERKTRLSDNAFWLHVAAAPQIIYGVRGLIGIETFEQDAGQAVVTVLVLAVLAVVSLGLNRRALIVSGVVTFAGAIWALFGQSGLEGPSRVAGPLIFLGATIVLLGGGWRTARKAVLTVVPRKGLIARIFPPETQFDG